MLALRASSLRASSRVALTAFVGAALALAACSSSTPAAPTSEPLVDAAPPGEASSEPVDAAAPDVTTLADAVAPSPGHHVFSHDGIKIDLEVPDACAAGGCGLVLDIHGLTMNADQEDRSTGLRALVRARGYVLVQPNAPRGLIGPSWTPITDDAKVWSAVASVRAALKVDPERVHVTGFSQGGAMTFRLLCAHADEIASAAPVAAADGATLDSTVPPFRLDCPFDATSQPAVPRSILQMHGTLDGLVPIAKARQQEGAILTWLGTATDTVVAEGTGFRHRRYASAAKGVVFEYLEHDYVVTPPLLPVAIGGHCLPGGDDLAGKVTGESMFFSCAPPNGFVWGPTVMDFFAAHPRGK